MKYLRVVALFACALAMCAAFVSAQEDLSEAPEVEVISISGSPQVCKAGETEYTAIEEGMFLKAGDKIQTDESGSIELSFDEDNQNVVRAEGNTEMMLRLEDEKLELIKGKVFSIIDALPPDTVFEIRTPTAVTGVRGTDWVTSIEDEETVVEAVDGTPYVKSIDASGAVMSTAVDVPSGYMTRVKHLQKPGIMQAIPVENRAKLKKVRTELKQRAIKAIERRGPDYKPRKRPIKINPKGMPMKGAQMQDNKMKGKVLKPLMRKQYMPPPRPR